jgi:tRNA nucleotidyltransferase/poly(A) polymerase
MMKGRSVILGWSDAALEIAERLDGWESAVYIVGGAVRDAYLRRPTKDFDLVTTGSGIKLGRWLADRMGGAFYPLDSERDVGRALIDTPEGRLVIDAARLRGDDLEADLRDRDFTMNAMAVDLRGALDEVFDPLGGLDDLKAKVLRQCSAGAVMNDPIRALRAVRLAAQFGLRIETETLRSVREAAAVMVSRVSAERIRDELFKLMALPKPTAALRVAENVGLLSAVLPETAALRSEDDSAWMQTMAVVEALTEVLATISPTRTDETAAQFSLGMIAIALDRYRGQLQTHLGVNWADERPHRALLVLAALLSAAADEDGAAARADALRLSSAEKARLAAIVSAREAAVLRMETVSLLDLHRWWRALGEAGVDAIILALAEHLGRAGVMLDQDSWLTLLERAQQILGAFFEAHDSIVDPPALISGTMLMETLGLKPGRQIGMLLDLIREGQVRGEIRTVEDALRAARAALNGSA